MRLRAISRRLPALLFPAMLLLVAGCGAGGGGPIQGVISPICLTLVPSGDEPASGVFLRQGPGSTCDDLDVEVVVQEVNDVLEADFTLTYDTLVATFVPGSPVSPHLSIDLNPPSEEIFVDVDEVVPGMIEIGIGRLVIQDPSDCLLPRGVSGTGVLITLEFSRTADSGTGAIAFVSPVLRNSECPPVPIGIPAEDWRGGAMDVTQ